MEEEVVDITSSRSVSQFVLSRWVGRPDGKRTDELREGRKRGIFDIRREGTRDSGEELLKALAGGGPIMTHGRNEYIHTMWGGRMGGHTNVPGSR